MQKTLEKLKRSELFELLVEQAKEIESYQAKLVDLEKELSIAKRFWEKLVR